MGTAFQGLVEEAIVANLDHGLGGNVPLFKYRMGHSPPLGNHVLF